MTLDILKETLDKLRELTPSPPRPGVVLIPTFHAFERVLTRFPISKKKRIRKKWAKRPGNYTNSPRIYQLENVIFIHPSLYLRLQEEVGEPILSGYQSGGYVSPSFSNFSVLPKSYY